MPQRIQTPTGEVIEFPDDMTDEAIGAVMRREFGGPDGAKPDPIEAEATKLADQIEQVQGPAGAGSLFRNSFSLGLQDKVGGLVGGVGSLVKGEGFGKGYHVAQRAEEIVEERARSRSGAGGVAAEIGGALATGALAKAPAAATWLARAGQAATEGAVLGAGQGVGDAGGSLSDMAGAAVGGGLLGGGLGAGLSGALDAGAGLYRAGRGASQSLGRIMDPPEGRAVRMVNESLQRDDVTAAQAAARMRRSQADPNSPNLALMDVADQNTLGLAAAAAAEPGSGRRIANRYLDQRAKGQPKRTMAAATQALGDPNAFRQTGEQLAQTRAAHGSQLYGQAWQTAKPVDVEPIIQALDSRIPSAKGGIQSTLQRVRNLMVRRGSMGELPERDLRSLHEVKMELDNILSSGGDSSLGKVARGEVAKVKRQLLDAMDRSSPAYAAARSVYADESALMNALETGRRFMREDVDELEPLMASMGAAERKMFQQGAVREIRNIVETAPDGADTVKRVFGSEAKRKALRAVFKNDKEFRQFTATMLREAKARGTRDIVHVRRGSRTAVLQGDKQAASGANEVLGAAAEIATGGIGVGSVVNKTTGALAKMLQSRSGMSSDVAEQVARIMVQEDPAEVVRILSLGPQAAKQLLPSSRGQAIRRGIAVGGSQALPQLR
jgi:hypothetical protein